MVLLLLGSRTSEKFSGISCSEKKCEEVHLCRSLKTVMLMFFKLQRSHGARESSVINHSGQHAYVVPGWGLHTEAL